jgi:hypothetical protein
MDDQLFIRIRRMYAAIGATEEKDLERFKASAAEQPGLIMFAADFTGGMADEELANAVQSAIYNVAHLRDHLRRWARAEQKDPGLIDSAVSASLELKIVLDLADFDKHGGSRRDGGYSKLDPRIKNIDRALRLQTKTVAGSVVSLTFGRGGAPVVGGDGSGSVVITGTVVDGRANVVGDLREILIVAIGAWERTLDSLGAPRNAV